MAAVPAPQAASLGVVIADPSPVTRRPLVAFIVRTPGLELVAEVADGAALGAALCRGRFDVLLVDDRLVGALGPHEPGLRMIVLGLDDNPAFAARARRLGAEAWLSKDQAGDQLPGLLVPGAALPRA